MVCGITECVFGGSHSPHPLFGLSPASYSCLTVASACGSGFRFPKKEEEGERKRMNTSLNRNGAKGDKYIFVALILTPSFRVTVFRKPEKASKSQTAV